MIGVFDSGHGGLTVLRKLTEYLPTSSFIYLGDHRNAPYGNRATDDIYRFTIAGVESLFAYGCRLVIIACNTAAATSLRRIQQEWLPVHYPERRVIAVFIPIVEAVTGLNWDRNAGLSIAASSHNEAGAKHKQVIAVFATRQTVNSGSFTREITGRCPDIKVIEQACPLLAPLIEQARPLAIIKKAVRRYVCLLNRRLQGQKLTDVILGCTHYPLIEDIFTQILPSGVNILSQPEITAKSLIKYLQRWPQFNMPPAQETAFYSTKPNEVTSNIASQFYGRPVIFKPIT